MTATPPPTAPQGYPVRQPVLRAPEGTEPSTVWIWLLVALPLVQILASIPLFISVGNLYTNVFGSIRLTGEAPSSADVQAIMGSSLAVLGPSMLVTLVGYLLSGVGVLLGWLDWRALLARGVPKPFHWAWGFFAFTGAGTLVTLIGRSVVVHRRTGRGLAPLWTGIAVTIAIFVGSIFWVVYLVSTALQAITVR